MKRWIYRHRVGVERCLWITFFVGFVSLVYWGNENHLAVEVPYQDSSKLSKLEFQRITLERRIKDYQSLSDHLKAQVKSQNKVIADYEKLLHQAKVDVPPQEILYKSIKHTTLQEKGFEHETKRILGNFIDVSRIRVQ